MSRVASRHDRPISISRMAQEVGLTRAEVAGILHEHDVPLSPVLGSVALVASPADWRAIRPVLERTFANKIRRNLDLIRSA